MASFWLPLTSLVPKWKNQSCDDPVYQRPFKETLHTPRARWSRDPSITSTYAKTQDCNIFSTPTQIKYHSLFGTTFRLKPDHEVTSPSIYFINQFTGSYMTQVPTVSYLQTYFSKEIIKTPQHSKTSLYSDQPQDQIKFIIEDDKDTMKLPQTKELWSIQKYSPALETTPFIKWSTSSQSNSIYWFSHGADHYWKVPPDRH